MWRRRGLKTCQSLFLSVPVKSWWRCGLSTHQSHTPVPPTHTRCYYCSAAGASSESVQHTNLLKAGVLFDIQERHQTAKSLLIHFPSNASAKHNNNNGGLHHLIPCVAPGFVSLHWHPNTTGPTYLCCLSWLLLVAISCGRNGNFPSWFLLALGC